MPTSFIKLFKDETWAKFLWTEHEHDLFSSQHLCQMSNPWMTIFLTFVILNWSEMWFHEMLNIAFKPWYSVNVNSPTFYYWILYNCTNTEITSWIFHREFSNLFLFNFRSHNLKLERTQSTRISKQFSMNEPSYK